MEQSGEVVSEQTQASATVIKDNTSGKARTSLILGIIGIFAWVIPIIGFPVTIVGLVFASKGMKSAKHSMAVAGLVLSIIGLLLSIVNASIGAYMGATGTHPLVNEILQ